MNIAFIPVRSGSQSIPLKNIKDFCGKPLVYWTIQAAVLSKFVDKVVIATDSKEIKNVVESFRLSKVVVYDRLLENAQDTSSTESVMLEYLNLKNNGLTDSDIFMLVQATSPLTQTEHFSAAVEYYLNNNFDSLLSCVRIKRFFWNENGTSANYDYSKRPRRQDFAGILMENGAFYINTVQNIKNTKNRLSGRIGIYEMPDHTAVELDDEDDWIMAESLMYKHILCPKTGIGKKIKLFISDVDGVLTDGSMYYSENGDELKRFHTHDGMGFKMLMEAGIKTAIITSENTRIVQRRAEKLKIDYVIQGVANSNKLDAALDLCRKLDITLNETVYIGDDMNCYELLINAGIAACPLNAVDKIKNIPGIIRLKQKGGEGVVRELVELILK